MAEELTKGPDEIYCPECGRTIQRGSTGCPLCYADFRKMFSVQEIPGNPGGLPLSSQNYYQSTPTAVRRDPVKNKVVAIVLAVFFGFWAWLYTYGKNSMKFWSMMGVFAVIFVINIAYSCSMVQDAMSGMVYDENYFSGGFLVFMGITYFIYFAAWVWAVVDNATKPESYFRDYPNG
jgi:hypothetical protein